jgi:hypothetical protein
MGKKYTDEELIMFYKNFALELGRTPKQQDINNKRRTDKIFPSAVVFGRRFNGLSELNKICGLSLNYKIYSDNELLDLLFDLYQRIGFPTKKIINNDENMPNAELYTKRFGSFKDAIIKANIPIPEYIKGKLNCRVCELTDEELLKQLLDVINKHGIIPFQKFRKYGLKSSTVYRNRFGTYQRVLELAGIEIPDDIKRKYFSSFKNITNNELINHLKDFYKKFGIPTTRILKFNKDMPSDYLYRERFGSFQNALIEAGICIPESREWLYNRKSIDDDTIINVVTKYINNNFTEKDQLPSLKDLYVLCKVPSYSVLKNRFYNTENFYNKLSINYYEHNKKAFELDMINKYMSLKNILGYVPDSRDVDRASKQDLCYGMKTYSEHFGSLIEFQKMLGYEPTANIGLLTTKEDALKELKELGISIGRLPTQKDVNECEWLPSATYYAHHFNSYGNALILAGFDENWYNRKVMITPKGNLAFSSYEYDFTVMLENNNFIFKKEDYYKNYINGFLKRLQFDHVIFFNNDIYFIEIFGIMEYKWYRDKTVRKIKLCEDNDLKLIDLYKEDFKKKNEKQLYEMLMERIENFE